MATYSSMILNHSALGGHRLKLPFMNPNHNKCGVHVHQYSIQRDIRIQEVRIQCFAEGRPGAQTVVSAGRTYDNLSYTDDSKTEPFWSNAIKEAIWAMKSLVVFLLAQPGQLKYIEWPRFQNTLKTATMTLVLVTLLIVALASVDSALSYMLVFLLRRKA